MAADRIVAQDYEVASRLDQLGLTASELIGVVHQAVAAKAAFVLNHPLNAAGQLSYIYGTGALRDALRAKGWEIDRTGNIEATIDPESGMKIQTKAPRPAKPLIKGNTASSPNTILKTKKSGRRKTPRSGIFSCTSTVMMSVRNCHSPRGSKTVSLRALTNASTSSSPANGPA
jgi:hypothetical protein